MNSDVPFKYLEDPKKYCSVITNLIEKADDNWQVIWKTAIPELFGSPEYSINSINSLLKVIEKAFKERTYHVRAQAFVCWQFFIEEVEKQSACEKLLNVILIPLSASNHSMKIVLDAKLEAWLTLLNTTILSKSLSREKGVPSLLKILYGPHTLRTASSYSDLLGMCGTIYRLVEQKCSKNDENNIILSYLQKALSILSANDDTRLIGKEIWIDVIEIISERKWPITQFNYLFKTLENLLLTNSEQDRLFISDLLPILICEYNSFPSDHLIPQLNLLTRCLLSSASCAFHLSTTLEYSMKKFRKREQILLDALHKTLVQFSEDYNEQSQKCWSALVTCFCKWNKNEADSDNYIWILLFPVKYFHEKWNSIIQDDLQKCFESMCSSFEVDTMNKNISRRLKTFLNNSENVPVSLLSATICLCKIILQKSKLSDDVSVIGETLIIIHEKLPSQTIVEGVHNLLLSKFLSCVLYYMERYPDCDSRFKLIISKYSECIDVNRDLKEYPIVQLISKYMNNKVKDDEKSNVNKILACEMDSVSPNRCTNRNFLARLSPAENKQHNSNPFAARTISNFKSQNENSPKLQKCKTKDDNMEFVAIRPIPKNSPMTEHQKEIAKEKSYIPALYEGLSQSHSDSQSMSTIGEKFGILPATTSSIVIMDENTVLPSSDPNADSADEIPASLNFCDAIRSNKSSNLFASKKSLFNENASHVDSNEVLENTTELDGLKTKTSVPKRKSERIESKTAETTIVKRSKCSNQGVESTDETFLSDPENVPASQFTNKVAQRSSIRRKSVPTNEKKLLELKDEQSKPRPVAETEPQSLPLSKTISESTVTTKMVPEGKSVRSKSLKSKNVDTTPLRSPINTRKRKSSIIDAPSSSKKPAVLDIVESCSETDEMITNVKTEKDENSENKRKSVETNESNLSCVARTETENSSELIDSVMIVDDGVDDVITIDSQSPIAKNDSQEVILSSRDSTEVVADEGTTLEENFTSHIAEQDQSFNESVKSTQTSFNLALTESESSKSIVDEADVAEKVAETQEENIIDVSREKTTEQPQITENFQNSEHIDDTIQKTAESSDKRSDGNIDHRVTTAEETNTNASPLSNNSRTSLILQMAYDGAPNLNRLQPRFKTNARSPSAVTSPASNRSAVNGAGSRMINLRNMKMMQVNGFSTTKATPNKLINLPEKIGKFKYIPKECTSPSILKKPNLNVTISPKSPKSVNFAEKLTDTREFRVGDDIKTDSWSSNGTQGSDNLLSDDEAVPPEALYISLQNCTDDIGNIAERLTLNKEQLDTLRRMGIETVGQLASANTIVGKSIPVGDNRIQRLRNALIAYDNDRRLKGLRAPSVRRKITYNNVKVSTIIDILDDEPDLKLVSEPVSELPGPCEEPNAVEEETTTDEGIVQPLCPSSITLQTTPSFELIDSKIESPSEKASHVEKEPLLSSPIQITRSQTSPSKSVDVNPLSSSTSAENLIVLSSPIKTTSPTNHAVETIISSPNDSTSTISSPMKGTGLPINLGNSPGKRLSSDLSSCAVVAEGVDESLLSPVKENYTSVNPEKSPTKSLEIISASSAVEVTKVKCDEGRVERETENEITNVNSVEPTQDDELDFICTNSEQVVFPNRNRRTYSKLMKARSSMNLLQTPELPTDIVSCSKSSPFETIVLEPDLSLSEIDDSIKKDENEVPAGRTVTDIVVEEQQSVSIFSSEGTKSIENKDAPTGSEVILMEDETLAVPNSYEVKTCVDRKSQTFAGTECVFYALLQRMLAPYLGPSCLSKWAKESASREEIYKIIRSLDEGMEWIQSVGLMDSETKNFLNQLKYFKASD